MIQLQSGEGTRDSRTYLKFDSMYKLRCLMSCSPVNRFPFTRKSASSYPLLEETTLMMPCSGMRQSSFCRGSVCSAIMEGQLLYSLFTTHGKRSVKQKRFWIICSSRIGPVLHSPKESPLHEFVSLPMHLYGFGVGERGYIVAQFFTIPAVITIKAEG
jgi:hypothetical protein